MSGPELRKSKYAEGVYFVGDQEWMVSCLQSNISYCTSKHPLLVLNLPALQCYYYVVRQPVLNQCSINSTRLIDRCLDRFLAQEFLEQLLCLLLDVRWFQLTSRALKAFQRSSFYLLPVANNYVSHEHSSEAQGLQPNDRELTAQNCFQVGIRYTLLKAVGTGSFSSVCSAIDNQKGEKVTSSCINWFMYGVLKIGLCTTEALCFSVGWTLVIPLT